MAGGMPARSPYRLDIELGLLYYTVDEAWSPLSARVPRPEGFIVIEEVDGRPCTEFRGGEEGDRAVYLLVKRGVDHLKEGAVIGTEKLREEEREWLQRALEVTRLFREAGRA